MMPNAISPIIVEIHCAQQDERARGKTPCASRANANIIAADRTHTQAYATAKRKALNAGWKVMEVRTNGRFRGLVCPSCFALMKGDRT